MSTNTASSTPAVNKTKYGDIPLLTALNYNSWQRTVQEIDADEIISGEEDEAKPCDMDYNDYKTGHKGCQYYLPLLLSRCKILH